MPADIVFLRAVFRKMRMEAMWHRSWIRGHMHGQKYISMDMVGCRVEMTPGYYSAASSSRVYNADNDHDGQQSGSDNADPDSENTDENDPESDYDDSNSEDPDSLEDGSTEDTSGGALNNGGTSGGSTEGATEGAVGKNVQNTKWYNTKIFYTVMWTITVILFAGIIIFIIWYIRNRKKSCGRSILNSI